MALVLALQARPAASAPASARRAASRKAIANPPHASADQGDNLLVRATVEALTEGLRLAGVGAKEYQAAAAASPPAPPLRPGDVAGVLRALRADFDRSYFVTGQLSDEIYDEACLYADPTVSFSGRELYKRNLALLVPFLWDAAIELRSLRRLPPGSPAPAPGGGSASSRFPGGSSSDGTSAGASAAAEQQQQQPAAAWWRALLGDSTSAKATPEQDAPAVQLLAEWRLTCWLRLPWAPYVAVNGTTTYTLNANRNKIVRHMEAWDISATQALLLLLRPSERAAWRRWGRRTS
ncbi:hypothetical protein ABPG75_005087 [Micractinium tetrahymenae]